MSDVSGVKRTGIMQQQQRVQFMNVLPDQITLGSSATTGFAPSATGSPSAGGAAASFMYICRAVGGADALVPSITLAVLQALSQLLVLELPSSDHAASIERPC